MSDHPKKKLWELFFCIWAEKEGDKSFFYDLINKFPKNYIII